MFSSQVIFELLDLGLESGDLLVLVIDLVVGGIEFCSQFLDELILIIDPVLKGNDGLSQSVHLIGQLLVQKIDLIFELGQMGDLVEQ